MPKTKIPISKEWLVEHYIDNKQSTRACSALLGCTHGVIRRALVAHDILTRTNGESRKIIIGREWLEDHYSVQQLSAYECGQLLNCSKTVVLNRLSELDIPRRANDEKSERTREKLRETHVGKRPSQETIEKNRLAHIGKTISPEQRAKIGAAHRGMKRSQQTRENISKSLVGHPALSGPNSVQWRGGASKKKYCPEFNVRTRRKTRERFNRTCLICGAPENGKHLAVHHIDYNKMQGCKGRGWLLVTLCASCHGKTCHERWHWFALLINHWAINPAISFDTDLHGSLSFG